MGIFTGSALATLEEPEIPQIPLPQLEKPKIPELKIPKGPQSQLLLADTVYVIWKDSFQGTTKLFLKKSTDGGNTFGAATTITSTNNDIGSSSMVVDTSKNIYVVWADGAIGNSEIYLKKSTDGGNTFGQTINISNTPADSYNHDLAVYGDNIYVTWREDTQTGLKLLIKKSSNGGNTFGPANVIWASPNDSDSVIPSIALAAGNRVYAVWRDIDFANIINPVHTIFLKKSNDGNNTFIPPYPKTIISGLGDPGYQPIIAVTPKPF